MQDWNQAEDDYVRDAKEKHGAVDWRVVDDRRIAALPRLLAARGLATLLDDASGSPLRVGEGSLWTESQLEHIARVWHQLTPWPGTVKGLELLNEHYATVTLSNTYQELIKKIVSHSSLPFTHVYSADMFGSYKPDPKVYMGAAEKLGVKPEECALVAAHLGDLKGAKACGFYAIYVERPLEEKNPELEKEGIPDMVIKDGDGGFVALTERLRPR